MENKTAKLRASIRKWNFDKKFAVILTLLLIVSNMTILFVTSQSAVRSLRDKSSRFAQAQLATINQILETEFKNIASDMETIAFSDYVKDYVTYEEQSQENSLFNINSAYQTLNNLTTGNPLVDYAAIIAEGKKTVLYSGEVWTKPDFKEKIVENYGNSTQKIEKNIRYNTMQKVFYPEEKVLNFYLPINKKYDIRPDHPVAVLVVGMGEKVLRNYLQTTEDSLPMNVYLSDSTGRSLVSNTLGNGDGAETLELEFKEKRGTLEKDGELFMYQKMSEWDWYTVSAIKTDILYQDTKNTVLFLVGMIAALCICGVIVIRVICRRMYRPMQEIVVRMKEVSAGNLDTRMKEEYSGEDFQNLARGFNSMASHIHTLMEEVLNEQHELEQSKLNALQSQIKPHFLYNTLECIHWQALSEGNREVSRMVKALANYYRLCLSHGQDIITLGQELAHIRNYLIIQNMRYDDIVTEDIHVEKRLEGVLIPKMTLQPLVENAIYHGLKVKAGKKGTIRIDAWEEEERCVVSVSDTGVGMTEEQCEELNRTISQLNSDKGYGVRNVHKRIEILFGKEYGLHYFLNPDCGVRVEISLPRLCNSEDGED